MSSVTQNAQDALPRGGKGLPFVPAGYSLYTSRGKADGKQVWWRVVVRPHGHMIAREVCYKEKASDPERAWDPEKEGWEPEGVIWPTWPTGSEEQASSSVSPLAEVGLSRKATQ